MAPFCILCTTGSWKVSFVMGIISILIGTLFVLFPAGSLQVIVYSLGFIAFVIGIMLFVASWNLSRAGGGMFAVPLLLGIVAVILGVVTFVNPEIIGVFMAVLVAIFCMIGGLGMAFTGFLGGASPARRLLTGLGGLILAALGVLILFSPQISLLIVLQLIGVFLIGAGITASIGAILQRRKGEPCTPEIREINYQ